jgi:hypothetical protein
MPYTMVLKTMLQPVLDSSPSCGPRTTGTTVRTVRNSGTGAQKRSVPAVRIVRLNFTFGDGNSKSGNIYMELSSCLNFSIYNKSYIQGTISFCNMSNRKSDVWWVVKLQKNHSGEWCYPCDMSFQKQRRETMPQ